MIKRMILPALSIWVLVGCGKEASYEPVEINPDIDVCEVCNMSITEPQFAAETIMKDGHVHTFDDIGCMVEFLEEASKDDIGESFIRDTNAGEWAVLNQGSFVYDPESWTPMSFGVLSFSSDKQAEAYLNKHPSGELLSYEDLWNHSWEAVK
ncbi:copper chaperone NosL [Bacillus ectoiniformans]|uniref:nitrous oxide reductase accessory protein NosL n=1 Tax=Bacillus ectoiniformans TaxID=1494429 RepID=UPI001EF978A5|nr:nitrous oxide reductase accessory protein NosL [Bacillus ectoiniformans]MBM7649773.1 copper chaperone NosL [Bacillus ectoiniformans]